MSACWHCGAALCDAEALRATVAGHARAVCCPGCRAAAEWIDQLGLGDYYRLRSTPAQRPANMDDALRDARAWTRPDVARHVVRSTGNGQCETIVLVDGLRCSGCVWLLERALAALPGVDNAQINAVARRARITWAPDRCDLPSILDAFARTGYRALPLDATALDDTQRSESRAAVKRLVVAGFGAMQAMMYASAIYLGALDTIDVSTRDLLRWFGLLVATPVVFYAARQFFSGALRTLRARRLGMDVPVALAIGLIYAASVVEALRGGVDIYFDSVSMFVFFLLIGRHLEMLARHRAGDLVDALARLAPVFADRIGEDGTLERVGAIELERGDHVRVASGARVPADGALLNVYCRTNEALLTGESNAVTKRKGDALIAGSLVVDGPADVRVERIGNDTVLAGILTLSSRAHAARPRLARMGDQAVAGFVARVLALAVLTAVGWALVDPARAFSATLAVLVISCPCAFALAVPAALTRVLGVLAQRGVLVVRPDAIEALARATHVLFDKTGTLTDPQLALEHVEVFRGGRREEMIAMAAALAQGSRHPIARALAHEAGDSLSVADSLRSVPGNGVEGVIGGQRLRVGSAAFALAGKAYPAALDDAVVMTDRNGALAAFHLRERLRTDARPAVDALAADGLKIELASGDSRVKVEAVAARLAIADWSARQQPADKLSRLIALRSRGARVVAVGDGINDAPVLAAADVSIALADGVELAQATSDIVLTTERLGAIAEARRLSHETLAVLQQNQRWALAYNLIAMPFAALGFVPAWLAAVGMSASSLVVIINALRIGRRVQPAPALAMPAAPSALPA